MPLALARVLPVSAPAQSAVSVFVNGQRMSFDQPPIVQSGRVFVPLRGVFEQLGASVVYNNGQINAPQNFIIIPRGTIPDSVYDKLDAKRLAMANGQTDAEPGVMERPPARPSRLQLAGLPPASAEET